MECTSLHAGDDIHLTANDTSTCQTPKPKDDDLHFPFLSLPRETRDYIYNYLLQGSRFQFTQRLTPTENSMRFTICYEFSDAFMAQRSKFPLWLLVCKQVLAEGLDQLYRSAYCSSYGQCWCDGCTPPNNQCEHNPGKLLELEGAKNIEFTVPISQFSIGQSGLIDQHLLGFTAFPDISEKAMSPAHDLLLEYLAENPQHPAKRLKFKFSFTILPSLKRLPMRKPPHQGPNDHSWAVDLSVYQKLGSRFDRVKLALEFPVLMTNEEVRHSAMLHPKFKTAAAELGKFLVGGLETNDTNNVPGGNGGWRLYDSFQTKYGEAQLEDINCPYDWFLEVIRQPTRKNGVIRYMGLSCFKRGWSYFHAVGGEEEGESWFCEQTGDLLTAESLDR